jgi:hypothetical protein
MAQRKQSQVVDFSNMDDKKFISTLKREEIQDIDIAIDFLYDYIDPLLISINAFGRIDLIIEMIISKDFDLRILIALLTITHSEKEVFNNRAKLIEYTRKKALEIGLTPTQISNILQGF